MQVVIKLKGFLKIIAFFALILLPSLYVLYKTYGYIRRQAVIYFKTNPKFSYTYTVQGRVPKGYLLLTPSLPYNLQYGRIVIIDMAGHLVFDKKIKGVVSDFRQWKAGGHTLYSYAVYDANAGQALAMAGSARHIVILDSALHEIKQVHLQSCNEIVVDKKQDLDHHDFLLLTANHYYAIAAYPRRVSNIPACLPQAAGAVVAAPVIQETDNDKVVWQWDGSKYPELYLNSNTENNFYDTTQVQDYAHINSISIDPADSNLIVSFHNLNEVIKVNRHTGDILWRLGGKNSDFPLNATQMFFRQHNATMDSAHHLLLFDNGEKPFRSFSRILEFGLDEQAKKITSFKAYDIPEPIAGSRGSVQKIGGYYLICGGSAGYVLLADTATGAKHMEIKTSQPLYRAYYTPDIKGVPLLEK